MNKEKNFVSAVIYVHNAENRIKYFLKMIIDVMEENFEHSEIICVNDSSDDNSLDIIKLIGSYAKNVSISVVNLSYFHGLEAAMNAGVDLAIGDFIFEFDNTIWDFDKTDIMKVYYHSLKGYDIVKASPDRMRKMSSKIFYKFFEIFTQNTYKMSTESFRILSRRAINRISSVNKTVPYRKVVYANSGLKVDEVKYLGKEVDNRILDKKERRYRFGLAIDTLLLFTNAGYRFALIMTMVMMLLSIFMIIYTVTINIMSQPIEGWTTTILFLSFSFFGIFGGMTIIIKYLQLLVDLVFRRKTYSFESIEKISK